MKTRLDFFQGGMDGDGTLGTQEQFFDFASTIKPYHTIIPHTWVPGMLSLQLQKRALSPPATILVTSSLLPSDHLFLNIKILSQI